jgi:sulfonate transport system substrate-binding protein
MNHQSIYRARRLAAVLAAVIATSATFGAIAAVARNAKSESRAKAPALPTKIPAGTTLRIADQGFLEPLFKASGEEKNLPYKLTFPSLEGGPAILEALEGKSVDAGEVADAPLIFAQAAHQPVIGVAAWVTQHTDLSLVAAPGSGVTGWASLKGKSVAYSQGSVFESVLLQGLQSAGLTIKSVTPVNLAPTSIGAALKAGQVQAAILIDPLTTAYLLANPGAQIVAHVPSITDRTNFLISNNATLANRGKVAALANFIKRLKKALEWANTHPQQWAVAYYGAEGIPAAFATKILSETGTTSLLKLPSQLGAAQQQLANLYTSAGEIPAKLNTSTEFNTIYNGIVGGQS